MEGQLLEHERSFLFYSIVTHKPKNVIEIGTWKGGGSTLQIVNGLRFNSGGHLYTCEKDIELYNIAISSYRNDPLNKYITFYNLKSTDFLEIIVEQIIPDFVFFDGGEDAELNLRDFQFLNQYLPIGARFMAHDWDLDERIDGGISQKNQLLRPYLEINANWKIITTLSKPTSVGLVLAEKISYG